MSKVTFGSNILNDGSTQTNYDSCIISRDPVPQVSKAGLYLPQGESREELVTGTVESIGPEVKDLKPGDRVLYERLASLKMMLQGFSYDVVREDNICAQLYKDTSNSKNKKKRSSRY